VVRKAAGLEDVRLHDLRHTFASFGAAGGLSLPIIGKLLGHSQAATTQRYAHLADDPVARAADQVGNAVAAAMEGGGAEVVQLDKASVSKGGTA
jgi:integrase